MTITCFFCIMALRQQQNFFAITASGKLNYKREKYYCACADDAPEKNKRTREYYYILCKCN